MRRISKSLLAGMVLAWAVNIVGYAHSLPPLTRHVREVTFNGEAHLVGRLPGTQSMRIVLVLPLRNQEALDNFLKELYDPSSASYRQFLSVEEFTAMFGPRQEDYDAVINFAESHGLKVVATSRNRLNLDVMGSVSSIEQAFHINMGVYQHPTENRTFYAPDREPTPDLQVRLWHVAGLDNFSLPRPLLRHRDPDSAPAATTGSGPSASFLGSDMRAAYYGGSLTGSGQSLGLLEYAGTDLADLSTYYSNVGQPNNVPVTLLSTDGTSTSCVSPCDDIEQTLDMTQALGMAPGLSSLVMYVGSSDAAIFNAMATASPLNAQLSSSWTWSPADPSTDNPYFQEFAAQGQNLFQAAGDSGAWTGKSSVYPADDAYLTSVGGTDLTTSSAGGLWSSETVWVDGGGGISPHRYAIPSWQKATASGCSSCSKTYRNGPDVSANANFTFYVCGDQTTCTSNYWGGTSFAAPMWAGYMALINEQALANGKPTLGFINPSLYSIGLGTSYDADFHDITSGSNGYSATTGYDLASGWGSPNGAGLVNSLTGSSSTGSFTLSSNPSSVSVTQGQNTSSTITVTPSGGYTGTVDLSVASGCPSGATCALSPTFVTISGTSSQSATLNITTNGSTATGNFTITVTGTDSITNTLTSSTTVSLTVNPASSGGSFTLTAGPASQSIKPGGSTSYSVTVNSMSGFSGSVSLSVSGLPRSASGSFSPNPVSVSTSGGSSTLTVTTGRKVAAGTYTLTITGTSGTSSSKATVSLVIL